MFNHRRQLDNWLSQGNSPGDWVLQEYLDGPSFSLEVVGTPGNYIPVRVTDLEMDAGYDCKRVLAPTRLASDRVNQLEQISLDIAEAVKLNGLMDVEVILHNGELKVLEIDARLPSQTPTAVYWSTGINILELLAQSLLGMIPRDKHEELKESTTGNKGVVYEHIMVTNGVVDVCGEHIMAEAGPLHLHTDFFGADEALSNYAPGRGRWAATLIIAASGRKEAIEKRDRVIHKIQRKAGSSEEQKT
jgi:pyrrolysine biosynthesis protein PylC